MVRIKYHSKCSSCGKDFEADLEVSEADNESIESGSMTLKDAMKPGTFQKELFISGMCYDCQEKVFNRPAPGHEKEWGSLIGECEECGSPLYERDVKNGRCPSCRYPITRTGIKG